MEQILLFHDDMFTRLSVKWFALGRSINLEKTKQIWSCPRFMHITSISQNQMSGEIKESNTKRIWERSAYPQVEVGEPHIFQNG
jgi:hypothetical protein